MFFSERYPDVLLKILGIDQNEAILRDAKALFKYVGDRNHVFEYLAAPIRARSLRGNIGSARFDIIIVANLLNELTDDGEPHRLCKHLLDEHLNDTGHLIVIDPALRETTRPLMEMRDRIVEKDEAHVLAPCLHQKYCPMLRKNERDWCHLYIEWDRPKMIGQMDEHVGTDHTYLKMAYLILQRAEKMISAPSENLHRVVSSPLVSKGKIELVLCADDGILRRVRRLDRDRSELNADFDRAKRGDIVYLEPVEKIGTENIFRIENCLPFEVRR